MNSITQPREMKVSITHLKSIHKTQRSEATYFFQISLVSHVVYRQWSTENVSPQATHQISCSDKWDDESFYNYLTSY